MQSIRWRRAIVITLLIILLKILLASTITLTLGSITLVIK